MPENYTISPSTNPEVTTANGGFHWDAVAGKYEIEASAPNCHAVGSKTTAVATAPFVLPPPVTGLVLRLDCPRAMAVAPQVTGVDPSSGPTTGGNQIAVVGNGLATVKGVYFGSRPASRVLVISPDEVVAVAPPGTSRVAISVTTASGRGARLPVTRYSYFGVPTPRGAPVVSAVRPDSGPLDGGTHVTIKGKNLKNVVIVEFGGINATIFTCVSPTELYAVVPQPASRPGGGHGGEPPGGISG